MSFDCHQVLLSAAGVIAWIVIVSGLAQTVVYILQLVLAALALSQRPPVARSSLLWHRYGEVAPPRSRSSSRPITSR